MDLRTLAANFGLRRKLLSAVLFQTFNPSSETA